MAFQSGDLVVSVPVRLASEDLWERTSDRHRTVIDCGQLCEVKDHVPDLPTELT